MDANDSIDQMFTIQRMTMLQPKVRSRSKFTRINLPKLKMRPKPSESLTPLKKVPRASAEHSFSIGLKYYRLPENYPGRFATYSSYTNANGDRIPLLHRDLVETTLRDIDRDLQPVFSKFGLFYAALSENHPTKGKAAMTYRIPVKFHGPNAFAHHIKIRVRSSKAPNDSKRFFNRSTLLAVLFHELAHIKQMDHGKKFMLLLRDIYRFANGIKLIPKGEEHQLPSCRSWEKLIFQKRGNVSKETLLEMFDEE